MKLSSAQMVVWLNQNSIRRADLRSESQTPEPGNSDALLQEQLHERLAKFYDAHSDISSTGEATEGKGTTLNVTENDADEYEFRLFAKPTKSSDSIGNRVVLRSPTPPSGDPGFLKAKRPDTFYFTGRPSEELLEQYQQAAVSGEQLARGLDVRWVWS